jgi:hypothetical protein
MQERQRGKGSKIQRFAEDLEAGRPTSLSLEEYVLAAYLYDEEKPLPKDPDHWHSPVWHFAWLLSGHPDLGGRDGYDVAGIVFPLLQKRLRRNAEEFWASAFGGECPSEEDGLADFANSFNSVRYPPGTDRLQAALFHAKREPVAPPHCRTPGYVNFISLAFWLDKLSDGAPIFLPCQRVARLLRVQPMTVSRWRREAVADGLLRTMKQHTFSVREGSRQATEFQFNPDALNAPQVSIGTSDTADTALKVAVDPEPLPQTTSRVEIARLPSTPIASAGPKPKAGPYCPGDEWRALGLDGGLGSDVFRNYWKALYARDDGLDTRGKVNIALESFGRIGIEIPTEFRTIAKVHDREG